MKHIILVLAFIPICWAVAPTKFTANSSATAQQAILSWVQTYTGTCTMEVSESPTYSPVVNDVNTTLFSGSATTETGAGPHTFIAGKRTADPASSGIFYSRSLAASTPHYARLNCNGETAVLTFTTAPASGLFPESPPWNASGHGNTAWPEFDFTDISKPVIDPQTGARVYRVTDPTDMGFVRASSFDANSVFLGTSWTSLQNLAAGSTGTLATTATTNWAFIPVDATSNYTFGGYVISFGVSRFQVSNIAIRAYGSVTDTSGENGKGQMCLSIDGGANCYTDVVDTTAFTGSSTDRGLFPTDATLPGYSGWSKPIPANYRMTRGYVSVSGSTVTLNSALNNEGSAVALDQVYAAMAWFRPEWAIGSRIFITGSSGFCTNSWCTIASVTDRDTLTISESGTLTNVLYKSGVYGVMFRKKTATGSMSVSLGFSEQAHVSFQQGQSISCSPLPITTTKSKTGAALGYTATGSLCLFNAMRDGYNILKAVFTSPVVDVRILSLIPTSPNIAGYPTNDQPALEPGYPFLASNGLAFSTTDANSFYLIRSTQAIGAPKALWKLTYPSASEYVEPTGIKNSYSRDGLISGYTDPLAWANLTRDSLGASLTAQITANTTYNASLWPALSTLQYVGYILGYHWFYTSPNQDLPATYFIFTEAGVFSSWFDTLGNGQPGARFGGSHSSIPYGSISTHIMAQDNAAQFFGGPFKVTPTCIMRGGTCTPGDTSVSSTIGHTSYDSTCPAGLPASLVALGAVSGSNQCLTMRVVGEPCSATPTAAEVAAFPCPNASSSGKSWIGSAIAPLDGAQDAAGTFAGKEGNDFEMLILAKTTSLGGDVRELVWLRDGATGYRCRGNYLGIANDCSRGRNGSAGTSEYSHGNNWVFYMTPRGLYQNYDPVTQTWTFENEWLTRGHADRSYINGGTQSYAGICCTNGGYASRIGGVVGGAPTSYLAQWPPFAGVAADASSASLWQQSYIASSALGSTGLQQLLAGDWRHVNPGGGCEAETVNSLAPCQVGVVHTFALESGTTSVYRICGATNCATTPSGISGSYDPKKVQIYAWAGAYGIAEKSSATTGNTLTDGDTWKFCYALQANECRSGSSAGWLYAVIPNLQTDITYCNSSQISVRAACIFAGTAVMGNNMQMRFANDPDGIYQRKVGQSLTRVGAQMAYSHVRPTLDGRCYYSTTYNLSGWYTGAVLVCTGAMVQDSANRTAFQGVKVQNTATSWYVKAGYNSSFECMPRAEACVADSTTTALVPMKWAYETPSAVSGAGTVTIAAIPGRVLYYAIVANGVVGTTQKVAVP